MTETSLQRSPNSRSLLPSLPSLLLCVSAGLNKNLLAETPRGGAAGEWKWGLNELRGRKVSPAVAPFHG